MHRKALRSLQSVAKIYGLVSLCNDVRFSGGIVGHMSGGECLRMLMPKTTTKECRHRTKNDQSVDIGEGTNTGASGYCL